MNVLACFAHPDDEVLGAGGTLAKHAEAGDTVGWCFGTVRGLSAERNAAAEMLGLSDRYGACMALADQKFELASVADTAAWLHQTQFDPDVIYTHHPGDLNLDHQFVARVVLTAYRPKPGEKHRTILACEVLSSTEYTFPQAFSPNWFEELTQSQLWKKREALTCYPSELQEWPHPRSLVGVTNVAEVRGQQIGVDYAEAFQLLRRSC